MLERLVETFCAVDDFCQAFMPQWEASLLSNGLAPRTGTRPLRQRNHYDFGDQGYLGKQRAAVLLRPGLVLLTKVRKHMKSWPFTLTTKLLLNARNMAATIIGHIKAFSSLNLSKHRAPINAFLHLLAALTAYQLNPIKPAASFFPLLSLLA